MFFFATVVCFVYLVVFHHQKTLSKNNLKIVILVEFNNEFGLVGFYLLKFGLEILFNKNYPFLITGM